MILGIGNDLCSVQRIAAILRRHGMRFVNRAFTGAEQQAAARRLPSQHASFYAKRFAAKEACAKALGTGFRDGITLRDIGVISDSLGRPALDLTGGALVRLQALCPAGQQVRLHLSLSDDADMAQAFVILESAFP